MTDSDANAHEDLSQRAQAPAPLTPAAVLRAAADLIEPAALWTQGRFGSPEDGCYCLMGAIIWSSPNDHDGAYLLEDEAMDFVREVVGDDLGEWNDAPERTQAEVVAALRAAAVLADGPLEGQEPDDGSALVLNESLPQ